MRSPRDVGIRLTVRIVGLAPECGGEAPAGGAGRADTTAVPVTSAPMRVLTQCREDVVLPPWRTGSAPTYDLNLPLGTVR
jgi:hypothetical protein